MLEIKEINKVLSSYGLKSNKYGPTIYQVNDTTGLCLEIKDPTFGYLTRVITFTTLDELDDFLSKYTWYFSSSISFLYVGTCLLPSGFW